MTDEPPFLKFDIGKKKFKIDVTNTQKYINKVYSKKLIRILPGREKKQSLVVIFGHV